MNQIDKFIDQIDLYIGRKNVLNVLEAGANDGADSLNLAEAFPNAVIHSFECNPESIQKCLAVRHERIKFTPIALGEENGEKLFLPIDTGRTITPHVDGNPGASSFYKANKDYSFETYVQTETKVPISRVDSLNLPPIDFIWLDAQGSELSILKGFGDTLKNVKAIKTEVLFKEQYLGAPLAEELEAWLESQGFRFIRYTEKFEWFGDAFFLRENL